MSANGGAAAPRGAFGHLGFILAAAGSAVGLGNLWKFPYIAYENKGGAFVLVYIAAVLLVGIPIMIGEVLLGRRTRRSPVGAFRALAGPGPGRRAWQGVGFLGVLTGFIILSYYSVVAGWTIRYILLALSGGLGELARDPAKMSGFFNAFLSDGLSQVLFHFLFMAATTGVVIFGVKRGIERAALVLMPALFLILAGLVAYAFTTSGCAKALAFLFRADFHNLTSGAVLEAVGHSFFTLSLGMGAMLTYGSYMQKKDSIARSAVTISVLDTTVAIMACIVMYSIIFSVEGLRVARSSTILFSTLPTVFFKLPGGAAISAFFYLLVAFAALTSTVSLLEVVASYAIDELGWKRSRATLTMAAAIFLFGALSALSLGANPELSRINLIGRESTAGIFGTLDYLASNWFLPVGGLLIALFVGFFMNRGESQAELAGADGRARSRMPLWFALWLFTIRFVAPIAVAAIIVSVILGHEYS